MAQIIVHLDDPPSTQRKRGSTRGYCNSEIVVKSHVSDSGDPEYYIYRISCWFCDIHRSAMLMPSLVVSPNLVQRVRSFEWDELLLFFCRQESNMFSFSCHVARRNVGQHPLFQNLWASKLAAQRRNPSTGRREIVHIGSELLLV